MTWAGALIPLLIVLVYAWPYITRFFAAVAPAKPEPPAESVAVEEFDGRFADISTADLRPPCDVHASEPWDEYWRRQRESGLWAFNEMFVDDRELLSVICLPIQVRRLWKAPCAVGLPFVTTDLSPNPSIELSKPAERTTASTSSAMTNDSSHRTEGRQ